MSDVRAQITEIAQRLEPLCSHISVRDDERGPFIFAIGKDDTHSLELWYAQGEFAVDLWHGKTYDVERIVEKPKFQDPVSATERSRAWLLGDAA